MPKVLVVIAVFLSLLATARSSIAASPAQGEAKTVLPTNFLIKLSPGKAQSSASLHSLMASGAALDRLTDDWFRVSPSPHANPLPAGALQALLKQDPAIEFIQPDYPLSLPEDYRIQDPLLRAAFAWNQTSLSDPQGTDNPEFPEPLSPSSGADPLLTKQWGMYMVKAAGAWKLSRGDGQIIVAVIDTGVDYTHEDLAPNLWRNPGESGLDSHGDPKESNGIDDDGNGFVDDLIGWDFSANDNKPYDLTTSLQDILRGAGNPGHGTHCAGTIAACSDNATGISGLAPKAKIMVLRFISEKGVGNTGDAVKAIKYAVDNGAKVLSNSWGSDGESGNPPEENRALREVIQYAQSRGALFIAAAGNGRKGKGYDNDSDPSPNVPSSYPYENILSVGALTSINQLAGFSNWGAKTVHLAAPGSTVFSTMVHNRYGDRISDSVDAPISWSGTSMAVPFVSGAAALYWSTHPEKDWKEVKSAILRSVTRIPAFSGKLVSEGALDAQALMEQP